MPCRTWPSCRRSAGSRADRLRTSALPCATFAAERDDIPPGLIGARQYNAPVVPRDLFTRAQRLPSRKDKARGHDFQAFSRGQIGGPSEPADSPSHRHALAGVGQPDRESVHHRPGKGGQSRSAKISSASTRPQASAKVADCGSSGLAARTTRSKASSGLIMLSVDVQFVEHQAQVFQGAENFGKVLFDCGRCPDRQ